MLPRTIPWPVNPWRQAVGALTRLTFHSMVSGPVLVGASLGGWVGRSVERSQGFGTTAATSGRAARALTTTRSPVTRSAFTAQWERYGAPIRSSTALIGAWVRSACARSVSNTYRPLATLPDRAFAPLRSARDARSTRNEVRAPLAVSRSTSGETLSAAPAGTADP